MIDDLILPVALTAAITAVTIVIRGLPPSGKVSLLRYCPDLNPSSHLTPIRPKLPDLSQSELTRPEPDSRRSDPNWTRSGQTGSNSIFSNVPSIILWILLHA